jgi:hypothetical protein
MGKGSHLRRCIRSIPAFTLVESLVVIVILVIMIGIGVAVGNELKISTERQYTIMELKNLAAMLTEVQEKCGPIPTTMSATQFLQEYQDLYAYKDTSGTWHVRPNSLTSFPTYMVQSGTIQAPDGTNMPGIINVYDAFNAQTYGTPTPIYLYCFRGNPHSPFFFSTGPSGIKAAPDNLYSYQP